MMAMMVMMVAIAIAMAERGGLRRAIARSGIGSLMYRSGSYCKKLGRRRNLDKGAYCLRIRYPTDKDDATL